MYLLGVALIFISATLSAQTIRLEVGGTASRFGYSRADNKANSDLKLGYRLGAGVEFKLFPFVYAMTGANLNIGSGGRIGVLNKYGKEFFLDGYDAPKQVKEGLGALSVLTDPFVSMTSISVPLNLGVRFKPAGILGVSLEAGPYISYDIRTKLIMWGNHELDLTNITDHSLGLVKYNRLGYGVGASVALEITRAYLRLGVEYGLNNRVDFVPDKVAQGKIYNVAKENLPTTISTFLKDLKDVEPALGRNLTELQGGKIRTMQAYITLGVRI